MRRHVFTRVPLTSLYLFLYHRIKAKWGIEIPRQTAVGDGLYIGHFGGIVVAPEAVIGKHCSISHDVTIGVSGQGEKKGWPIIGDNVYIAPGAKVFGKIRIGNNVEIGANAVIHSDIPDNAVVVLDPGYKIISFKDHEL